MAQNNQIIYPLQPFFVLGSEHYMKKMLPGTSVAHFYAFDGKAPRNVLETAHTVVPDGSVDIIFFCEDGCPKGIIAGPVKSGQVNIFRDHTKYFGARLLPGAVNRLTDIAIGELVNQQVDLCELTGRADIIEQICLTEDFQQRVQLFMTLFPQLVEQRQGMGLHADLTNIMLQRIYQTEGQVRVSALEEELVYSRRQLLRVFKEGTGIDIKKFCRIIRFQHLIYRLNHGDADSLSQLAADSGYYDQTHFQKEFREFARVSPGEYQRLISESHYKDRIMLL